MGGCSVGGGRAPDREKSEIKDMAGHEIDKTIGDGRRGRKDDGGKGGWGTAVNINVESEVAFETSERNEGKEEGELMDEPRNEGRNLGKMKAAENSGRRAKPACCLIFNRIILGFFFNLFPHIYLYVYAGCVLQQTILEFCNKLSPPQTCLRYSRSRTANPEGISVDGSSLTPALDTHQMHLLCGA